ncbi:hypothetical protein MRX96_000633 [Rhipicephalus microplus]
MQASGQPPLLTATKACKRCKHSARLSPTFAWTSCKRGSSVPGQVRPPRCYVTLRLVGEVQPQTCALAFNRSFRFLDARYLRKQTRLVRVLLNPRPPPEVPLPAKPNWVNRVCCCCCC